MKTGHFEGSIARCAPLTLDGFARPLADTGGSDCFTGHITRCQTCCRRDSAAWLGRIPPNQNGRSVRTCSRELPLAA